MLLFAAAMAVCLCLQESELARQANQARDAEHLDEALVLYRKALAGSPNWAEGWWSLGTILYDRDNYAEATSALRKTVLLDPKAANAFVMLGLCESKLGDNSSALEHIEHGRQLGGGDDPHLRLVMLFTEGNLLLDAGQFGKAQDVLGALAREGVEQEEFIIALGSAVIGMKPANVSSADPKTRELIRRAGWAEHYAARRDAIEQAQREYEKLVADFPNRRNVQFAYGRFLVANHMDDRAVEAFKAEISNSPDHLLARLGIAGVLASTDAASGLPYARQAVELAPKLAEAHYLLGLLLLNTDKVKEALPELEAARRGMPSDSRVYFQLARAYTQLDRKEDASRVRAEFLRLKKQDSEK